MLNLSTSFTPIQAHWENETLSAMPTSIQTGNFYLNVARKQITKHLIDSRFNPLPPGCITISCAHGRAPEFYAETVYPGFEENFLGVKCTSLKALRSDFCNGEKVVMGYAASSKAKGNFFLETNAKKPYGKNAPKISSIICADGSRINPYGK